MLYVYHPYVSRAYAGLAADVDAFERLGIPHGEKLNEIPKGSVVLPRFRMLPFAQELEAEVKLQGATLLNSYREHRNIANLYNWVHLLEGLTPAAYRLEDIPNLPEGAYFLKGETNSKKANWFESAYAPTKSAVTEIARNLLNDQYIGSQELVIRPFQRYRRIGEAVNGQPVFHERRAFYLDGELLTESHYWNVQEYGSPAPLDLSAYARVQTEAVARVGHLARFMVIDYAEYEDGSWGVVELNDGSMAGLSANEPMKLWSELLSSLNKKDVES